MPFDCAPLHCNDVTSIRARWVALGPYTAAVLLLNLVWEVAQMPLYTLWWTAPARSIVFAIVHCTVGDVLIALAALLIAIVLFRRGWPAQRFAPVASAAVAFGLVYTGFSEWLNVYVRHTWAYASGMPILPGLGIGISPLAQWVVVPAAGLAWVHRRRRVAS